LRAQAQGIGQTVQTAEEQGDAQGKGAGDIASKRQRLNLLIFQIQHCRVYRDQAQTSTPHVDPPAVRHKPNRPGAKS
jgi:hypothetical protein